MVDTKHAEAFQTLISLLHEHEAFRALQPEEIAEIGQRAEIQFYKQGAEIIRKGEHDTNFYMVISGQLQTVDPDYSPPRLFNIHVPGDIVGLRSLLRGTARAATAAVAVDSILAIFEKDDWDWLVERYPEVRTYFENVEHRFDVQSLTDFPGRQPDEVVIVATKRHILAFIATLVWPVTILIGPVIFLLGGELLGVGLVEAVTDNFWLTLTATIPFTIVSLLMAIYFYLDWYNDDFIVTTKRVILIERILFYGEERHEAPLTRIQNVTVRNHGVLDVFFDVDDIEIKTAGVGLIAVDRIPGAQQISRMILRQQELAKARVSAADTQAVRQLVEQRLNRSKLAVTPIKVPDPKIVQPRRLPALPKFDFNYLIPKTRQVRTIKVGDKNEPAIVWRKHYYVLLKRVLLPLLLLVFSGYLLIASLLVWAPEGGLALPIWLVLILLVAGSFGWYIYQYDSWWRDIYMVTDSRIIDVESSAFRLHGEQMREGPFDAVQNITYRIPSFFAKLINQGDVIIETAAGAGKFTFSRVYNPSSVQEEIFYRWDAFQRNQNIKRRDETNKQIVAVLGEYHDTFGQDESQD